MQKTIKNIFETIFETILEETPEKIDEKTDEKIKFSFDRDRNGNRLLKIKTANGGFSIQSSQNLPKTHGYNKDTIDHAETEKEVRDFIKKYGTKRQQKILA